MDKPRKRRRGPIEFACDAFRADPFEFVTAVFGLLAFGAVAALFVLSQLPVFH
jgi:hypothetical protein